MFFHAKSKIGSFLFVSFFILGLVLTSCGTSDQRKAHVDEPMTSSANAPADSSVELEANVDSDESSVPRLKERSQEYEFPKSIKLHFKPMEITELAKEQAGKSWENTKTISFGEIEGEPVFLQVYKVPENEFCGSSYERVVLLQYNKETYRYQDCFSTSLESERPEQNFALFLLGYKQEGSGIVHGAVELSANGPGRMGYFYFDAAMSRWYGFEDWGYPRVTDLDGDGTVELVNQFPGLHMSWPDLRIYRWKGHSLEMSPSIKHALGVPNESYSQATLDDHDHRIDVVAVMSVGPEGTEDTETARYQYSNGEILRISEQ